MERVKEILKGIWAFCSYVFVPHEVEGVMTVKGSR